jgi:hypothetical protein
VIGLEDNKGTVPDIVFDIVGQLGLKQAKRDSICDEGERNNLV